jgi:hypothetical protein
MYRKSCANRGLMYTLENLQWCGEPCFVGWRLSMIRARYIASGRIQQKTPFSAVPYCGVTCSLSRKIIGHSLATAVSSWSIPAFQLHVAIGFRAFWGRRQCAVRCSLKETVNTLASTVVIAAWSLAMSSSIVLGGGGGGAACTLTIRCPHGAKKFHRTYIRRPRR